MMIVEEKRKVGRVAFNTRSVIVVCDTQEKISAKVVNVSPVGMAVLMPEDAPDIVGKDIIIVAETMIMYADVVRQEKQEDGSILIGISAKKFTDDVLEYLFQRIALNE